MTDFKPIEHLPLLKALLSDIKAQPLWRADSDQGHAYYDRNQLTPEKISRIEKLGQEALQINLVKPAINSVLGHEEKSRTDWVVRADESEAQEVAEGLNQELNEAARLSNASHHCSNAFASQAKSGIGWVYVAKNWDPTGSDYFIEDVHRDEMVWDMHSNKQDFSDCRWVARKKVMDEDEAKVFFPDSVELIEHMLTGFRTFEFELEDSRLADCYSAYSSYEHSHELVNPDRKQVAIYEVYYRQFESKNFLYFDDGRKLEYEENNIEHQLLADAGIEVREVVVPVMHLAWYIGSVCIWSDVSPHPHNYFPYVPFYGYREDRSNIPRGLVWDMIPAQDEYNNAVMRIQHIMSHKRIFYKSGAFGDRTTEDIVEELYRKDGALEYEGDPSDVRVEQDWAELHRLEGVLERASSEIRMASGIYNAFAGNTESSQSGTAIANAAELGSTTMAEFYSNFQFARMRVGELLLANIVEGIGDREKVINLREDYGQSKKTVVLNQRTNEGVSNQVQMVRAQVAMADITTSSGFQQQVNADLTRTFQVGNEMVQQLLMTPILETSNLPKRKELIEKWHEMTGQSDDPEEREKQKQQQLIQQQKELVMLEKERQAKVSLNGVQAKKGISEAELNQAKAAKVLVDIEKQKLELEVQETEAKEALIENTRFMMRGS